MKEIVFTKKATAPTAPYSQAILVGKTLYLAGVCGDNPATGKLMGAGDIAVETTYAMENLKATVEAVGGSMKDVVKVQVYVTDIEMLPAFNAVYQRYFPEGYLPARIAMEICRLADGANLELDAVAVLD